MVEIVQLKSAEPSSLDQINGLLRQLSENIPACTPELLKTILENPMTELWIAKDGGAIIGMGELAVVMKPEGIIAQVEDVVVDKSQRGKGLGKLISQKLIERARARGARAVQLSSNPSRTAANKLYKDLGFKLHETNYYRLKL